MRAVTEPACTREASKAYISLVVKQTKRLMPELQTSPSILNDSIDPSKDLKMHPFWIVAEILYGKLTTEMRSELERIARLREDLIRHVIAGGLTRFAWSKWLPTAPNRMLASFQRDWRAFNDRAWMTAAQRGTPRAPIVNMYEALEAQTCSSSEILQTLDEMLFANLDVTVSALTWSLVQLAAHKDAQSRLRAEIARVRAGADECTGLARYLGHSNTYLQAIISESSRLCPLAAFSVPQAAPTSRVLDGYNIPPGTNFIVDSYSLNQRNPYWGSDRTSFRPERFLERKPTETRYNFWRFGFGPRQCLGKYIADVIIRAVLSELVQTYDLALPEDGSEWRRDDGVWLSRPNMKLGCKRRDESSGVPGTRAGLVWKPGQEISGFRIGEGEMAEKMTDTGRNLLEKYAGLQLDEVFPHVAAIVSAPMGGFPRAELQDLY